IVLGKYFGALLLIIIAILPTLLYIITISKLGNPPGNWDLGSTIGSYIGLLFLAMSYTAIGVFTSIVSDNQIVAFILSVFICFLLYYGFDRLANFELFGSYDYYIANIGMQAHFKSIARGVIDTRDLIYFISVALLFLGLTGLKLQKK